MTTPPSTCPHCGAEESIPFDGGRLFLCDTYIPVGGVPRQSNLCRERTAHAATRKQLIETTAIAEEFGRLCHAAIVQGGYLNADLFEDHSTALSRLEAARKGKAYGYVCPVCGEQISDSQETVSTDSGMAHEACCAARKEAKL